MFGWFRRKAGEVQQARIDVALEAANRTQQFMLQVPAALGAMPKSMLKDPFIVGAVASFAAIMSRVVARGSCPQSVTENSMILAMQLSFSNSPISREEAWGALHEFKNHPDYTKALQVVTLILGARMGRKDLASDPLICEARKKVKEMPPPFRSSFGSTEEEQTAYQLTRELFVRPLQEKYGELWRI